MAIDSRQKRQAIAGVGRPYMRAVLANSVSAAQRPAVGNAYPVSAGGFEDPVPPQEGQDYLVRKRRRRL